MTGSGSSPIPPSVIRMNKMGILYLFLPDRTFMYFLE